VRRYTSLTRIEIPIPQPETQQDLAFEFIDHGEDLIEFRGESTAAHIAAFRKVNQGIDEHFWSQSAVVASLTKKYGEKSEALHEMSTAVELSEGYLRQMARTYRTFKYVSRDTSLSFSHHKVACRHTNPVEALAVAKANGFSKDQLIQWVSEQSLRRASKATRTARSAARNSWREHLLHMDDVIVNDFMKLSPNQEFARRVCAEWRVELADELKQLDIVERRELIVNAIDERGAEDVKAIRQATGIDRKEIEWTIARLVEENLYEWVDKGGKTEVGRGTPSKILHKVGDVDGSAFHFPRVDHEYAH
jgi:hypothetical protein